MFHDNLAGVQWLKRMCVWSVAEGKNYLELILSCSDVYTRHGL